MNPRSIVVSFHYCRQLFLAVLFKMSAVVKKVKLVLGSLLKLRSARFTQHNIKQTEADGHRTRKSRETADAPQTAQTSDNDYIQY